MRTIGSSGTYTDVVTAASSNAAQYFSVLVPQPTLAAKNTSVITPLASSFTIQGPPITGTNQTITNPYAFNVQNGSSRLSGPLVLSQTNTSNTVSLVTSTSTPANYTLTLPSSVPATTGQALLSDTSGNLSWGSAGGAATQSTFSGANNVTTATAVTGLTVSSSPMTIPVYVYVNATSKLAAVYVLTLYFNPNTNTYMIETMTAGDDASIIFTVNASGQVLYTSGNYAGFSALTFTWYTPYTPVSSATSSLSLQSSLSVGTSTSLANNTISGTPSSSSGNLLLINGATFTDTSTAASGTAPSFNGIYIGAPILKAANTAVTTTNASSLTIAGPPTASTNETITNAYAFNVLAGLSLFGGNVLFNATALNATGQQYSGRFYLSSSWTPPAGWNYLPSTVALAADLPPTLRASVSNTNVGTTLNFNTTTGLLFLPVSGTWSFNIFAANLNNVSTSNGYEFRIAVVSAPAWPAAGSAAKTYGQGQTAQALIGIPQAQLASTSFLMSTESGLSYTGKFPATTLIAIMVYSNNGNVSFPAVPSLYFEASLISAMT